MTSDTPTCGKCGYSLVGLQAERCPECGTPINPAATGSVARDRTDITIRCLSVAIWLTSNLIFFAIKDGFCPFGYFVCSSFGLDWPFCVAKALGIGAWLTLAWGLLGSLSRTKVFAVILSGAAIVGIAIVGSKMCDHPESTVVSSAPTATFALVTALYVWRRWSLIG